MFNWLIKLLGGFTRKEVGELKEYIKQVEAALEKAQRNDMPNDPKTGRFVKK